MDYEAAIGVVSNLRDAARDVQFQGNSREEAQRKAAVHRLVHPVAIIAGRIAPSEAAIISRMALTGTWALVVDACDRLIGNLESAGAVAAILRPQGPQLAAAGLHRGVWNTAATLWDGGHRREAVQTAATYVDTAIQAKAGRSDVSGTKLAGEVFSLEPPKAGRPRLRFRDFDEGSLDWISAHEGAQGLARGCASGIRNLVTHSLDQPSEQVALEYLATLSALARWVDRMEVVAAP